MKKHVLLMASSLRGGGSERQVLLLLRHLDRSRFVPYLYLSKAVGDFLDQIPDDTLVHAYDANRDPGGVYFPGRALRKQVTYLKSVVEQNEIDVIYDRTFHMTLLAGSLDRSIRRVSTIVSPPHLAVPLVEKRFVALKRRRLAQAYRRSDVVVAVSRQAARSAERYYGLDENSVRVLYNPVDHQSLVAAAGNPARRTDRTTLVCVGRMSAEKGHADLIDALPSVIRKWPSARPRLSVRFIGDGHLRGDLENRAHALDLGDTLAFAGIAENAAAEIAKADALVLPSRFEGMPNVVLEAMALRVPVIATRAGGTIELERDEATAFWADVADRRSIATAILNFAQDPTSAQQHVDAAFRLVQQQHDVRTAVETAERFLDPSDRSDPTDRTD